jgi:ACT domain-containing protein
VVAAAGLNRPGIVATLSAAIAEMGCDLASMNQVIVDGYFSLLFIVEISEDRGDMSFRVFKENLKDVASRLGTMEIFVMHEETFQAMHRV